VPLNPLGEMDGYRSMLGIQWLTYQDPRGDALPAFGRVWDQFPQFAPDLVDDRDPPRSKFESVEAAMVEFAHLVQPGERAWTTMYRYEPGSKGRDRPTELTVQVKPACDYHRIESGTGSAGDVVVYPQYPTRLSALVKPPLLSDAESCAELIEMFKAVAGQLECFVARVSPVALSKQFRNRGFPFLVLEDIGWINWFGPSVLGRWGGPEALAGVGVFQERVGDSLVVWATEAPPERDDTLTGSANYPWKWPFYNAVGRESWWKADPEKRELTWEDQVALVGVRAPSPDEHRRYARQWEGES
jgi:hypothetical protein